MVLTSEKALSKIKHYCAYQERNHQEVKEKLYGMGLKKVDVETILSTLIEEDYLNEERFARQFAGVHFRLKKWGKVKIAYELKQKRISPLNISLGLKEIDDNDYREALKKLAIIKWNALKHEQYLNRQAKTTAYLLGKGYEAVTIYQVINQLKATPK